MVTCLLDIAPLNVGHVLILPKKHYVDVDEMDEITANAVIKASAVIAKALKNNFIRMAYRSFKMAANLTSLTITICMYFPGTRKTVLLWVEPSDAAFAKDRLAETKDKLIKHLC